jgi:D-inositol-3-phosphate glycosyltransferase
MPDNIKVGLLTGGIDRPYVFGFGMALASKGVSLDIIGSDIIDRPELHEPPRLNFLNLRGSGRADVTAAAKIRRVLAYYARLIRYAWIAEPKILHILWDNKFQFFDRTLLVMYYKALGKKVAFTAMNVNARRRDNSDSMLNRFTLRVQYHLVDHIFVHTQKMKEELLSDFGVGSQDITIIPMGINNSVPDTELTAAQAKARLGVSGNERTILFFGGIQPYKGLEYLVAAFQALASEDGRYRLLIVGAPTQSMEYWKGVQESIAGHPTRAKVIQKIEYVPDDETELYFKAADVAAMPYTDIFQSGVLVLSYGFGLPVIASDVGSLRQDVVEGKTGFLCRPRDPDDLRRAIGTYFESDLYRRLDEHRQAIKDYTSERNSWGVAAERTSRVYSELLQSD